VFFFLSWYCAAAMHVFGLWENTIADHQEMRI
jgi:hypothetical protein